MLLYTILFYIFCFTLDLLFTYKNRSLIERHETNLLFKNLYKRFKEKAFIIFVVFDLSYTFLSYLALKMITNNNKTVSSLVFLILGGIHLYAFIKSYEFLKQEKKEK